MAGIEQRNGCVWYYGNPAGYIDRDSAVMDAIFQNDELERWLQKNHLSPKWTDGVYERLSSGGVSMPADACIKFSSFIRCATSLRNSVTSRSDKFS